MAHHGNEISFDTEHLTAQMDAHHVDVIVATSIVNVRYLTGIDSVALEMFPHTGHCFCDTRPALRPYFISSRCEVDQFLDAAWPLTGALAYGPFTRELSDEPLTEGRPRQPRTRRHTGLLGLRGDRIPYCPQRPTGLRHHTLQRLHVHH